jgi:hypothetical protein
MEDCTLQDAKRATAAVLSNAYETLPATGIPAMSMNRGTAAVRTRFLIHDCLGTDYRQSLDNRIAQSKLKFIHKLDTLLHRGIRLQVS